jgi:hypothetical protein
MPAQRSTAHWHLRTCIQSRPSCKRYRVSGGLFSRPSPPFLRTQWQRLSIRMQSMPESIEHSSALTVSGLASSLPRLGTEHRFSSSWRFHVTKPLRLLRTGFLPTTRDVGASPDGQSCLNLGAARLRYIGGTRMVSQMLHEHAVSLSTASHAKRSRRLIKCAKDSGHYPSEYYLGGSILSRFTQPANKASADG